MNTLFIVKCPLGDNIIFSQLIKDYHDMFPKEKLYIVSQINELFLNNPYVNLLDKNIKYDKIFDYNLYKFNSDIYVQEKDERIYTNQMTLQDTPYFYFNKYFNLNISHNNHTPCIYLNDEQKTKIQSDKPICLVNSAANYFMLDARWFGFNNYQQIINDFKDKINFISIGNNSYNQLINLKPFQNVYMDLINKTNILQLLNLIYNADIILTHESGILHAAHIISDKIRHVIALMGARHLNYDNYVNYTYNTSSVITHYIIPDNLSYYQENCYKRFNVKNCGCCSLLTELNTMTFENACKKPVLHNNELMSHCMAHLSISQIEEKLNNILATK